MFYTTGWCKLCQTSALILGVPSPVVRYPVNKICSSSVPTVLTYELKLPIAISIIEVEGILYHKLRLRNMAPFFYKDQYETIVRRCRQIMKHESDVE